MENEFSWAAEPAGGICTINGKNVHTEFGAYLKSSKLSAGSIKANVSKAVGSSKLKSSSYEVGIATLKLTFYVGGATKEECSLNTSNIIFEGQNCIIQLADEEFEYDAILTGVSLADTEVDFYSQVEMTFNVIKRLPAVTVTFDSGQGVFNNKGTAISGALITVTPKVDLELFVINGIEIKGLTSGQPFLIDGLEGTVTCNGVNRFLDTNLIDFPKASPGVNRVTASTNEVEVTVYFYPTFTV